jgi:recombination protein RecR
MALLDQLIEALRVLPGVGAKTAQRMAYQLLERNREGGKRLAAALEAAMTRIRHCQRCRTFSETELCAICSSGSRDASLLCAVETPADQVAIETATGYRGLYFVLLGRLSPLDGRGPRELGLDQLGQRLAEGEVRELIIATSATVEGEATAHYLAQLAQRHGVSASRLAHGVPLGGELEYIDRGTLAHAFGSRHSLPTSPLKPGESA